MDPERWAEVDEFVSGSLGLGDEVLEAALKAAIDAGIARDSGFAAAGADAADLAIVNAAPG